MKTADDLRKVLEARLAHLQQKHENRATEIVAQFEAHVVETGETKSYLQGREDPEVYAILRSHGFVVVEPEWEEDQDYGRRMGSGHISFEP